jgi:hypothetical protein
MTKYIRIGDKVFEVSEMINIDGVDIPVIKTEAQEIKRDDGSQDVVVRVPCLQISPAIQN